MNTVVINGWQKEGKRKVNGALLQKLCLLFDFKPWFKLTFVCAQVDLQFNPNLIQFIH